MARKDNDIIVQKYFTATLSVPLTRPVLIYADLSIAFQEKRFAEYRDKATNNVAKVCFDRCRAILKWAKTCNAKLESIKNVHKHAADTLEFTFVFQKFTDMCDFINDLNVNVDGATMK